MKKLFFCLVMVLFSFVLYGQTNIKGVVVDAETNEPLIGASVSVKGTTQGVITDQNGAFQLNVRSTDVLVFSYLGYTEKEVTVGNRTTIDVMMEPSGVLLEEAVVTALGIKRDTRALGYAVSTIRGDDMVKAGVTSNPLASLYGKAAGVSVQATAAGPMGGMKINIRGAQGLETSSKTRPLFVVDGVPIYDTESSMASRDYNPLNSFDYGSAINNINVEDIASMEILKSAKAAVLYGSAGANGVVLITTKSGAGTRGLGVEITYNQEIHQPYSLIKFQNEFGSGDNEYSLSTDPETGMRRTVSSRYNFGPKFDGSPIKFFDGSTRKYEPYKNNYLDLFDTGSAYNVTAAISGGNEKANMRLSLSRYDYTGITPNQSQIRNTLSYNGQVEVSKFARFEFIQNFTENNNQNRYPNNQHLVAWGTFNRDYDMKTAMNSYKDENGWLRSLSTLGNLEGDGWGWPAAFLDPNGINDGFFNFLYSMSDFRNIDKTFQSTTHANATLTFLPFLKLRLQGGLNYVDIDYISQRMPFRQDETTGSYQGGGFSFRRERNVNKNFEAFLQFDKFFMDNKLNIIAFAGPAYQGTSYTNVNVGTRGNSKFPGFWSLSNSDTWPTSYDSYVSGYGQENESLYSVFGQTEVRWGMEYIFEFQARNDWASTLPKQNRSYFYPGASFTWNFTETFNIPAINYGKFYMSLSDIGRPASRYYALRTYNLGTLDPPNTTINRVSGPSDLFSGDLKPERRREFELGLSLRMFNNRLEFNPNYYNATWYNQIMSVPLSATTGATAIRINAGEINNQGFELFINGKVIDAKAFEWAMTWTGARQWDKIIKLYPGITQKQESVGYLYRRDAEGERAKSLFIQDYARDKDGNKLVNDNGFYYRSTDPEDEINIGSTNVDLYGGYTNNFYFKGKWGMLNLMVGLNYQFGGKILSVSNYYLRGSGLVEETLPYRNAEHDGLKWTETLTDGTSRERHDGLILPGVKADGQPNDIIISAPDYYRTFINDMGNFWQPDLVQDNSYIKLRDMALTYIFPAATSKKFGLQKLSIGLTARNLFYLYKNVKNIDAEAMLGTGNDSWRENSTYPATRSYGIRVNVSF